MDKNNFKVIISICVCIHIFTINASALRESTNSSELLDINSTFTTKLSKSDDEAVPTGEIPRPPVFTKYDRMLPFVVKPAGSTATLKCPADGYPSPNIIWYKDNTLLKKDDRVRFQKWSLKLEHVTVSDEGEYTCVISNSEGSINFNFTMEVVERVPHRPIMIENYPGNQTAYLGETVIFECRFISDLHPALLWIKYVEPTNASDYEGNLPKVKYAKSNDPNNTDPTFLILHNVTYEDAGWYGCMASNTLGNSTQNAYLNVIPYPEVEEEKKKTPLLLIGLCVGLGICLLLWNLQM